MLLYSCPGELIVFLCHFVRVDALARSTCRAMQKLLHCEEAWHNALFVSDGTWYELKDVSLAAKYMNWSSRSPSPLPPTIDTMDNVAFWGIIRDGKRVVATFEPTILKFAQMPQIMMPQTQ